MEDLKILRGYNAPREDLKTFYISAIGSILEYGTKIWHGSLTEEQSKDIERIQRRGMKIICPEKTYEQALIECGMETLENRREKMCIKLINDMKGLIHKLNKLLPPTVGHVWERDTVAAPGGARGGANAPPKLFSAPPFCPPSS